MSLEIIFGLLGGLGLFIFGINKMADGLQNAAGDKLKRILELFTSRPIIAALTGAIATVIIQSSSSTSVMVVGFVNAGLMTLSQAVGTIMGANIGTTITAQIVAFDITALALPIIGIGAMINFLSRKKITQNIGLSILGFGMLFFGMQIMSETLKPLQEFEPFINMLINFGQHPLLGVLAGALFTIIIQSSSATTSLVIALSLQGLLDLPAGIAIILGSNIGTCITAILASIGTNVTARRAAIAHVLFNLFGVVIFLVLLKPFTNLVSFTANNVARQIANAHTIFNVSATVLLFPFIGYFVKFVEKLVPSGSEDDARKPRYLDRNILHTPAALIAAAEEALRMCNISLEMVRESYRGFVNLDETAMENVLIKEETINNLEKDIILYLTEAGSSNQWSQNQHKQITNLLHAAHDIERVGDLATNIVELGQARLKHSVPFSDKAMEELETMYKKVESLYLRTIDVLTSEDAIAAQNLIDADDEIDLLEKEYRDTHIQRLNEGKCQPEAGVLFLDVISTLERIADHATNLAETVTGALLEGTDS